MGDGGGHFARLEAIVKRGGAELTGAQFKILVAYEQAANFDTGEAFPSIETLAGYVGDPNTNRVRQARDVLVERGWLLLVRRGGGKNRPSVYRVNTGTVSVPVNTGTVLCDTGTVSVQHTGTVSVPRTQKGTQKITTGVISAVVSSQGGTDDRLAFLATKGIESTKAIRQALADYGWTLDELQALWRRATNAAPAGERQGWAARHIANGAKPQPAPTAPTAAPWIPPGAPKSTARASKVKAAAVLGTLAKASSDTAALAAYRTVTGEQESKQ